MSRKDINKLFAENFEGLGIKEITYDIKRNFIKLTINVIKEKYDKIDDEFKNKVQDFFRKNIADFWTAIEIEYIKNYIDDKYLHSYIKGFFINKEPLVASKLIDEDIKINDCGNDKLDVEISIYKSLGKYIEEQKIDKKLLDYLSTFFVNKVSINFTEKGEELIEISTQTTLLYEEEETKVHTLNVSDNFYEKNKFEKPIHLNQINAPSRSETIAGKIRILNKRIAKKTENVFYTFSIFDGISQFNCIYYTNEKDGKVIFDFKIGDMVIIKGQIDEDRYNNGLMMVVKKIKACGDIIEPTKKEVVKKDVASKYVLIKPEAYEKETVIHTNLFDYVPTIPKQIKDRTFVVFDTETTGLNFKEDEIIEIAACKIVNGKITETFSTLIRPSKPIPEDATKANGITNEMVQISPKFESVISDFYKFSYGAALVAHNISFDMNMLTNHCDKLGYYFENKQYDTLALAKKNLSLPSYRLESLAEHFDITIGDGSYHRALTDTLVTANVFLKLANNYNIEII